MQTQITILKLIKSETKKKKKNNNNNKANLTHLSHGGEEDERWWSGQGGMHERHFKANALLPAISMCV